MRQTRGGITLIEIAVVVALVVILAVITVNVVLRGQKRAAVAQTRRDMRSLAIAIESYYVDVSIYPYGGIGYPGPGNIRTYNWDVARTTGNRSGVADFPSFLLNDRSTSAGCFMTLTTPFDYLAKDARLDGYPADRFCVDRGATFVYWCVFPGQKNPVERNFRALAGSWSRPDPTAITICREPTMPTIPARSGVRGDAAFRCRNNGF